MLRYESTAWRVAAAAFAGEQEASAGASLQAARFDAVSSRRLLLPGYIVTYSTFGVQLRAVVNGHNGEVWGVQQEAATARMLARALSAFKSMPAVPAGAEVLLFHPDVRRALLALLLPLLRVAAKLLFFPPIFLGTVLSLGGVFAHATLAPYSMQRRLFQQWEATRAAEARAQAGARDEWRFRKAAAVKEEDVYAVLGLSSTAATAEEVQAAFRRQLHKYHPDHAAAMGLDVRACGERTAAILAAYAVLRDKSKRAEYDAGLYRGGSRGA